MSKISISELAKTVAKKHKMTIRESEKFIAEFIDVVNNGLRYDKQVKIKGLGTFKVIDTKNRKSVNIKTGEAIVIEGRGKITFTPENTLRDLINKPFAQFETVELHEGVSFDDIEQDMSPVNEEDPDNADLMPDALLEAVEPQVTETADDIHPVAEEAAPVAEESVPAVEEPAIPIVEEPVPVVEKAAPAAALAAVQLVQSEEENIVERVEENIVEPVEEHFVEPADENEVTETSEGEEEIISPEEEIQEKEMIAKEVETPVEPEATEEPMEPEIPVEPETEEPEKSDTTEEPETPEEPEVADELEASETAEPPAATETEKVASEAETEEKDRLEVEPVQESRVNPDIFEDRKATLLQQYRDMNEELEFQLERQKNSKKWLALISCILIAAACVGGYYAGSKITGDRLTEQYQSMLVDNVSQDSIERAMAVEAKADSSAKAAQIAKLREETDLRRKARQQSAQTNTAYETARERAKEIASIKAQQEKAEQEKYEAELKAKAEARQAKLQADAKKKEAAQAAAKLNAQKAAAAKPAAAAKQVAAKPVATTTKPAAQPAKTAPANKVIPVSSSKYDEMSAAVRLGAYRIVGIDQTVTVRKGQTLKSISKAFFGPGMECYVEALNGGIKEVSEGQKLKIPKLELKKKSKK